MLCCTMESYKRMRRRDRDAPVKRRVLMLNERSVSENHMESTESAGNAKVKRRELIESLPDWTAKCTKSTETTVVPLASTKLWIAVQLEEA